MKSLQTFSVKGQNKHLELTGHMVTNATLPLRCCARTAVHDVEINERGFVPINLYLFIYF